jgi:ADP-heptose:LPS heptosyltransferase
MTIAKAIAQRLWFLSSAPAITRRIGDLFYRRTAGRPDGSGLDLPRLQRVLIVRLDKIGDVVLSTPFFRELRRNAPRASITLIVSPAAFPLVAACPYVDEVQIYDWRRSRYFGPVHHLHALMKARRDLWHRRFELAVVPCWGADYYLASFMAYFSGAPTRAGYSERVMDAKRRLNRGFDSLFTHVSYDDTVRHEVEHNLDLLRFMGGTIENDALELWVSEADEEFAVQTLSAHGVRQGDLLIAIAPGAGAPKRCWPVERFVELAAWLNETHSARVVILGGPEDEALGPALAAAGGTGIDLVGKATLSQAAAVLRQCQLFIGNDSGPMHLAAAAGATVIAISCHPRTGSVQHENSPTRFGPWGQQHVVLQPEHAEPPCSQSCSAVEPHCITGVALDQVKNTVSARLVSQRGRRVGPDHGRVIADGTVNEAMTGAVGLAGREDGAGRMNAGAGPDRVR